MEKLKTFLILAVVVCAVVFLAVFFGSDANEESYDNMVEYVDDGDYETALNMFNANSSLRHYEDGETYYNYVNAISLYNNGYVTEAYNRFLLCKDFKDTSDYLLKMEWFFKEIEGRYILNKYSQTYFISFEDNIATLGIEGQTDIKYDIVAKNLDTEGTMVFSVGFSKSAKGTVDEEYMISLGSNRSKLIVSTAEQSTSTAFCGEYVAE